jgi:hypothetical protein
MVMASFSFPFPFRKSSLKAEISAVVSHLFHGSLWRREKAQFPRNVCAQRGKLNSSKLCRSLVRNDFDEATSFEWKYETPSKSLLRRHMLLVL